MKKITFLLLILTGACFADGIVQLLDIETGEQSKKLIIGVPSTAQQNTALAGKADATNVVAKTDIVQTLSGDETNKVPSVAAVNDGLVGIFQRSETSTTNIAKLHIVGYPDQSNWRLSGDYSMLDTNLQTSITNSYLNIYGDSGSDDYLGVTKILTDQEWGAEITGTLALHEMLSPETQLYWTMLGQGGQPLSYFEKGTDAYSNMLTRVQMTQTNWVDSGSVDVLIWGRCETGEPTYSQTTNLIADLRLDLSNSVLPIVFLGRNSQWKTYTNNTDQIAMRICEEDPYCYYISAKEFPRQDDDTNVHYDGLGQIAKGRAVGNAVYALQRGLELEKGFFTWEAVVDKLGATVASIAELRAGNAEFQGKMKAGEAEIGGVTISQGNITTSGTIQGTLSDTTTAIPTDYISLYAPLRKGSLVDPVNGLTMTNENSVAIAYDSTARGQAATFTQSSSNYLSFANQTCNATNISVSFWIKGTNTAEKGIIGRDGGNSSFCVSWHNTAASTVVRFRDTGGINEYYQFTGTSFKNGSWHNIIISLSGTNGVGYLDGLPAGAVTTTGGTPGAANRTQCIFNSIGRGLGSNYKYCDVTLDDVMILNGYAVTAAEAAAIYARQKYGDSNIQGNR